MQRDVIKPRYRSQCIVKRRRCVESAKITPATTVTTTYLDLGGLLVPLNHVRHEHRLRDYLYVALGAPLRRVVEGVCGEVLCVEITAKHGSFVLHFLQFGGLLAGSLAVKSFRWR